LKAVIIVEKLSQKELDMLFSRPQLSRNSRYKDCPDTSG